jgi:hypothetical protein
MSLQITRANGYNVDNMVFSKPIVNSKPIPHKRILIKTKYRNGQIGDLIIPTSKLYCIGFKKNKKIGTDELNGYSIPICMWGRDNSTAKQRQWTDMYYDIIQRCKEHLVDIKDDIGESYLDITQLGNPKIFSHPMAWRKENKEKGLGPILNTKVITKRTQENDFLIITDFYDNNNQKVDPFTFLDKGCFVHAAVKIESIFIGQKMSLQVKLYNCIVEIPDSGIKRLLQINPNLNSNPTMDEDEKEDYDDNPLLKTFSETKEQKDYDEYFSETKEQKDYDEYFSETKEQKDDVDDREEEKQKKTRIKTRTKTRRRK